jgi:ribosomal protein S21
MAKGSMSRRANIIVSVNDNNIERAMRQLKKRSEREGIVRDMKRVIYYEPESQKRRKRMMRAVKQNWIRMATSKLI